MAIKVKKQWNEQREKLLKKQPICEWCKINKSDTIHHMQEGWNDNYNEIKQLRKIGQKELKELSEEEKIMFDEKYIKRIHIICKKCHYIWHKFKMVMCPQCKKHYTKYDLCYDCWKLSGGKIESDEEW